MISLANLQAACGLLSFYARTQQGVDAIEQERREEDAKQRREETISRLFAEGNTFSAIGAAVGLPPAAARNILKKNGELDK